MSQEYIGADEIIGDDMDELFGDDDDGEYGADEIVGYDDEFSGRKRKPQARGQRVQRGVRIVKKKRDTLYRQILPLTATSVGAGLAAVITVTPQRMIRVERVVIPRNLTDFTVDYVNVGQEPQYVAQGSVPADIFAPDAVGIGLKGDTANVGNTITVGVTNTSAGTLVFRGAIVGAVLN